MPTSPMNRVVQHLHSAALLREGGLSDGDLLGRFIERRDEAAFAALVRRHGPMVWGVCRRLLDRHVAEDAFQATFLVLVRKAESVVPREQVGNWLYGVARRTALLARRTAARRMGREGRVADMPEPAAPEDAQWCDLQPLLDQELCRLPDRYRTVIVLCDLEWKTRKEAARQLGVPEGSVSGWLARGRAMLAKRLTRRGVALSSGAVAAGLGRTAAAAASVPPSVVSSTINAASGYAAGQAATTGLISVNVAALTEGVLKTMLVSKLKVVTAMLLVVVFIGGTAASLPPAVGQPPAERKAGEAKAAAGDQRQRETGKAGLQGRWEFVSVVVEGEVFLKNEAHKFAWRDEDLRNLMNDWIVEGDRLRPMKADAINSGSRGRFTLDDTRDPKHITLQLEGEEGQVTFRGIYSIEGGALKVCVNVIANDVCRPEEFVAKKGSTVLIATFKKVPPKK